MRVRWEQTGWAEWRWGLAGSAGNSTPVGCRREEDQLQVSVCVRLCVTLLEVAATGAEGAGYTTDRERHTLIIYFEVKL